MKKSYWKKDHKAYMLGGEGSPLSPRSVAPAITCEEAPVSCSTYGTFSENILHWIDEQPILEESRSQENRAMFMAIFNDLKPRKEPEQAKELKREKTEAVNARRKVFDKNRDQLMLAMLHNGMAYICRHPQCGEMRSLHVDHVVPLSKGGGDELSNLQFLCHKHNSEKGSKCPH